MTFRLCYFHSSSAAAECGKRGRSVYKGYGDWPVLGHGHGRALIRLSKYEADASRLSQGLRFPEVLLHRVMQMTHHQLGSVCYFFPVRFPPSTVLYFRHKHKRVSCGILSKYSDYHTGREEMMIGTLATCRALISEYLILPCSFNPPPPQKNAS